MEKRREKVVCGKNKGGSSGSSLSAQSRASPPPPLAERIHRRNVVSHPVVTSLNEFAKEFVRHGSQPIVPRFPLNPVSLYDFRPVSYSPLPSPPASVFDRIFRAGSAASLVQTRIKRNSSNVTTLGPVSLRIASPL